ncbi:MAG: hypothetical protein QOF33_2876, partial [Thermomicrobiales bacterium]|nr:hypothetical protein [Thermomicrobiales bacterium]
MQKSSGRPALIARGKITETLSPLLPTT